MANGSIFASIVRDFNVLAEGDIRVSGGAPDAPRSLLLNEAKAVLLARSTSPAMRDEMWSTIVAASRTAGDKWKTVALALAMPGLTNLARQFARDYAEAIYEDLCAEVVTGFLEALRGVDVERPAVLTRMYWATYRAVRRAVYTEVFAAKASEAAAAEARALPGEGHPDLVLARLVAENVITGAEASLISAVRLDRRSLSDVAELLGVSSNAVLLRLRKAEMRVAAQLTGTAVSSRRAFKQGRKSEVGGASDSSGRSDRTSIDEEPPGILAA